MTVVVLLGLGIGFGSWLIVSGVVAAPVPLERALADLHRRQAPVTDVESALRGTGLTTGLLGATWVDTGLGRRITDRVAADLRITGTTKAEHLAAHVGLGKPGVLQGARAYRGQDDGGQTRESHSI